MPETRRFRHETVITTYTVIGVSLGLENYPIDADHIVVFGYSCPALDFESANLLTRAYLQNKTCRVSVVDPDGAVATRYIDILSPKRLSYYSTAHAFLA